MALSKEYWLEYIHMSEICVTEIVDDAPLQTKAIGEMTFEF